MNASFVLSLITFLIQYLSSPSNQDIEDIDAFYEFLLDRNQKQLLDGLQSNEVASLEIKSILKKDQAEVIGLLNSISEHVATIASSTDILAGLVHSMTPDIKLEITKQQRAILRAIYVEGEGGQSYLSGRMANPYELVTGRTMYDPEEPNYLSDDLSSLVHAGLLLEDINEQGNPIWKGTRSGQTLAKTLFSETQ